YQTDVNARSVSARRDSCSSGLWMLTCIPDTECHVWPDVSAWRGPMGPGDRLVQPAAALHDAALRRIVDVHDPEALRVALRPLEVVEQRPGVVAGQWATLVDRLRTHRHVL